MPPNVMQFISSGGFYGAERVLLELARFVGQAGWGSRVLVMDSPGADAVASRAAQWGILCDRMSGSLRSPSRLRAQLASLLADHNTDLIHTHGYKTDVLARWTSRLRPVRLVATCHNWIGSTPKLRAYEWLDKRSLRGFDGVVPVSSEILAKLHAAGVPREKCALIPNGVSLDPPPPDFDRNALRAELGAAPGQPLLASVGRLDPSKANDRLLVALRSLGDREWRLVIVGDGGCLDSLRRLSAELGLSDRVHFAGFRSDVHAILRASDLMVIPSLLEGLPIVLLEAMGAGVPVVATRVGEIPAVIQDGRSGWLVPAGDPAALSRAIAEALDAPDTARARAGAAHSDYLARFSQTAMGQAYLDLYTRVLASAGPRHIHAEARV